MVKHEDNDNLKIQFSIGQKGQSNLGRVENVTWSWLSTVDRMMKNIPVDDRTIAEYRELSVDRQGQLKNTGFFVGGPFKGGIRKKLFIEKRQLITLDIDKGTKDILRLLQVGYVLGEFEYFVHSTRSHGGGKIKLHVIIPLPRPIDLDRWHAITRILAQRLDEKMRVVDPVSFVPTQVMYWPSTCADVPAIAFRRCGPLLDVDAELEAWGPWRDVSQLPRADKEAVPRDLSTEASDPTTKRGPVGAFCRLWNVEEAIAEFDLPYRRSEDGRWSFTDGTGTNGLVIYDDKKKCHSHHGSDPAFGQNNSFDLTAKHLFGHLDTPGDAEKDPTKQKSYQAMLKMLSERPEFRRELMESKYGTDDDGLDETMAEGDDLSEAPEAPQTAPAVRRPDRPSKGDGASEAAAGAKEAVDWRDGLAVTKDGEIRSTMPNMVLILRNVRRFKGIFAYSEFAQSVVVRRPIRCKALGVDTFDDFSSDRLNEFHRTGVKHILEAPHGPGLPGWGLRVSMAELDAAINEIASAARYHPVRDYFDALVWDGEPRLDRFLHKTCHVVQNEYHRQVSRSMMIGVVARTYHPGCKFDFLAVLESPEDHFKSTFVRMLAPEQRWAGEAEGHFDDPKKMVEETRGKLIVEYPELHKFVTMQDTRAIKNALSRLGETVRLSYRRDEQYFPRRYIAWGTTNEHHYLRDEENRRIWPISLGGRIDFEWLAEHRDQLYAEAVVEFRKMRPNINGDWPLYLTGEALEYAKGLQADRVMANPADQLVGEIEEWADKPVVPEDDIMSDGPAPRDVLCGLMIADGLRDGKRDGRTAQEIANAMRHLTGWRAAGREYVRGYGRQRVFRRIEAEDL